jgi:hypothetical protein
VFHKIRYTKPITDAGKKKKEITPVREKEG